MFDREAAVNAFRAYTAGYDPENTMIRLKIEHTFRVADLCGRIAGSHGMAGDGSHIYRRCSRIRGTYLKCP